MSHPPDDSDAADDPTADDLPLVTATETTSTNRSTPSPAADGGPTVAPPPRIGPYVPIARLGEGGMGEVWLAEQQGPVRRKVALKIIKRGLDTGQVVARFEAERQALAVMDHPAVAKVFEASSTPDGRPYFVMEHVAGMPITQHCDRERLTTRDRLRIFEQVCAGVQHAHQKGIIHRDLKPSNVLVATHDGRPAPKIIDFGIAKATAEPLTDRTLVTELGGMIGTPEYMSPEQAGVTGQDVDTRSDVYSLGVLLYELLVGALPFDAKVLRAGGIDGIRRRIRDEDPPRPATRLGALAPAASTESARRRGVDLPTLRRQLTGDLEWITMKAIAKSRDQRYGSPADLAADIERHLIDEPVLAGPPGAAYRARKFVRRHALAVGMTAGTAVLLVAFGAAMAWQAGRIARERDRANREAQTSEQALEFLTGLFKVSNPGEARGNAVTAREILDRGATRLESDLAAEPLIQARLMMTVGEVYQLLGLYAPATSLVERSLERRRKILGDDHPDTLASINRLATLLDDQGRTAEAEPFYREALAGRRRILGDDHPDTLRSINNMAILLQEEGNSEAAEPYFREALDRKRRVLGADHPDTLGALRNLGALLQRQARLDEAEPILREAVNRSRRVLGDDHPDTLGAIASLAAVLQEQGHPAEAEAAYREALAGSRRVLGNDHPDTFAALDNLAFLLQEEGKPAEAEPFYRQALEGRRRVLGDDHPATLQSLNSMGYLLQGEGRLIEAEPYYRDALARGRRSLGDDHPDTLNYADSLGNLYRQEGRLAESATLLEDTARRARALPPGDPIVATVLDSCGRTLAAMKRYTDAEAMLLEAHAAALSGDAATARQAEEDLAALYDAWSKPTKAATWRATRAAH